jgi:excisionase family DNA binding protein
MSKEERLTYDQVADILGVDVRTVRRYVARRKLRIVNLSHSKRFFRRAWLEQDLEKLTQKTA